MEVKGGAGLGVAQTPGVENLAEILGLGRFCQEIMQESWLLHGKMPSQ